MEEKIKKRFLLIVALIVTLSISIVCFNHIGQAYAYVDEVQTENKVYCTATINDDFTDDTVIITLTQKATFEFKDYSVGDFGIDCEMVKAGVILFFYWVKD